MYVADESAKTVQILTLNGTLVGSIGGFVAPNSVAVGPGGNFVVIDNGSLIYEFHRGKTQPVRVIGPRSTYRRLNDVSIGQHGAAWVTDEYENESEFCGLAVYPHGSSRPSQVWCGSLLTYFYVAADLQGNGYVTYVDEFSSYTAGVERCAAQGACVDLGYTLTKPEGVAVAQNGDVIVCDLDVGIEIYQPGQTEPSSTIKGLCGDFALGEHDRYLFIPQGSTVERLNYPSGTPAGSIGAFSDAVSVAIDGATEN